MMVLTAFRPLVSGVWDKTNVRCIKMESLVRHRGMQQYLRWPQEAAQANVNRTGKWSRDSRDWLTRLADFYIGPVVRVRAVLRSASCGLKLHWVPLTLSQTEGEHGPPHHWIIKANFLHISFTECFLSPIMLCAKTEHPTRHFVLCFAVYKTVLLLFQTFVSDSPLLL